MISYGFFIYRDIMSVIRCFTDISSLNFYNVQILNTLNNLWHNYYLIDFKQIVNQSNVYYLKSNDLLTELHINNITAFVLFLD